MSTFRAIASSGDRAAGGMRARECRDCRARVVEIQKS
jgi:hypothetical protein